MCLCSVKHSLQRCVISSGENTSEGAVKNVNEGEGSGQQCNAGPSASRRKVHYNTQREIQAFYKGELQSFKK